MGSGQRRKCGGARPHGRIEGSLVEVALGNQYVYKLLILPSLTFFAAFESGGLTISCTVLFPEQFDALRRTYDCEKSMIESLARCVKWNASGGKSGSAFLKTRGS